MVSQGGKAVNRFAKAENLAAHRLVKFAQDGVLDYADEHDMQAATVALLAEALILAGGGNLLLGQEIE